MKVTDLKAIPVSVPFSKPELWSMGKRRGVTNILVRLSTDTGIEGIGEAIGWPTPEIALEVINTALPMVIGADPFEVDKIIRDWILRVGWQHFPNTGNCSIAGVEMALWDIIGKACGLPLRKLWGGTVTSRVKYMYFLPRSLRSTMAEEAKQAISNGFDTIYIKVGLDDEDDIATVKAIRQAIGYGPKLRIDANEAWTPGQAIKVLSRLVETDLEFIEQPTPRGDIAAMAEVRRAVPIPVAANQGSWTPDEALEVIRHRAADVILTDPWQDGGLSSFRKVAAMCELAGIPVVIHSFCQLGIGTAATLQVASSLSNFTLASQAYVAYLSDDVITNSFRFENGSLAPPDGPGIGVEIDEKKVQTYTELYQRQGAFSAYEHNPDLKPGSGE